MIATKSSVKTKLVKGPVGQLEMLVDEPATYERGPWGIVCHPHPLYGGTMQNKVVTTLAKTFTGLGVTTVRFNFRGVGLSEGSYGDGVGELDDLLAMIEWVQHESKHREIWLAGFSFGGYIAACAASQMPVKNLVIVAPPVQHFPVRDLPALNMRWILAQGERDNVVPPQEVLAWAESCNPQPVILRFPEAGHFFHGQLSELRTKLQEVLVT